MKNIALNIYSICFQFTRYSHNKLKCKCWFKNMKQTLIFALLLSRLYGCSRLSPTPNPPEKYNKKVKLQCLVLKECNKNIYAMKW